MQVVCSKCGRSFHTNQEEMTVCPECLKAEFSSAPKLSSDELASLWGEYKSAHARQVARAERMNEGYLSGEAFSMAGKIRFAIGILLFVVCLFIFLVSDTSPSSSPIAQLDADEQRVFSVVFCWVAAGFVFFSTRRRPKVVYPVVALFLIAGWYMPTVWSMVSNMLKPATVVAVEKTTKPEDTVTAPTENRRVLTDDDLAVFIQHAKKARNLTHYGVYVDVQQPAARGVIRDALNRLLHAEFTTPYTRSNGALFLVANIRDDRRDISDILSRLGRVTYADVKTGVYEVLYDADKANMVSKYSPEVLSDPQNASFVTANLSELLCLEPMRVRMAARTLKGANVAYSRGDIREALVAALSEPWEGDQETYQALVETAVTYADRASATSGDSIRAAIVNHCWQYFQKRFKQHRESSATIINFLIEERPQDMVEAIVEYWGKDPVEWKPTLDILDARSHDAVQARLLQLLESTKSLGTINSIMRYLQSQGTREAIPVVEKFQSHSDSMIRYAARTTLDALKKRS